MADTTKSKLEGLALSAQELKSMSNWPDAIIEEWLNIFRNLIIIADDVDDTITKDLEEINTNFLDGSIPFVDSNKLAENNTKLFWNKGANAINVADLIVISTTPSRLLSTDAGNKAESADLSDWLTGSDLQPVNDDGDGTASHNDDELEFYIQATA